MEADEDMMDLTILDLGEYLEEPMLFGLDEISEVLPQTENSEVINVDATNLDANEELLNRFLQICGNSFSREETTVERTVLVDPANECMDFIANADASFNSVFSTFRVLFSQGDGYFFSEVAPYLTQIISRMEVRFRGNEIILTDTDATIVETGRLLRILHEVLPAAQVKTLLVSMPLRNEEDCRQLSSLFSIDRVEITHMYMDFAFLHCQNMKGLLLPIVKKTEFLSIEFHGGWVERMIETLFSFYVAGEWMNLKALAFPGVHYSPNRGKYLAGIISWPGNQIREIGVVFDDILSSLFLVEALKSEHCFVDHLIVLKEGPGLSCFKNELGSLPRITKLTYPGGSDQAGDVFDLIAVEGNNIQTLAIDGFDSGYFDDFKAALQSPHNRLHSLQFTNSAPGIENELFDVILESSSRIRSLHLSEALSDDMSFKFFDDKCVISHLTVEKGVVPQALLDAISFRRGEEAYVDDWNTQPWDWYFLLSNSDETTSVLPLKNTMIFDLQKTDEETLQTLHHDVAFTVVNPTLNVQRILMNNFDPVNEMGVLALDIIMNSIILPQSSVHELNIQGNHVIAPSSISSLIMLLNDQKNRIISLNLPLLDDEGMRLLLPGLSHPDCFVSHLSFDIIESSSLSLKYQLLEQALLNRNKMSILWNQEVQNMEDSALFSLYGELQKKTLKRKRVREESQSDDQQGTESGSLSQNGSNSQSSGGSQNGSGSQNSSGSQSGVQGGSVQEPSADESADESDGERLRKRLRKGKWKAA